MDGPVPVSTHTQLHSRGLDAVHSSEDGCFVCMLISHILEHTDEFYEDLAASEHIHRQTWRYSINGCMCINTPDMESEEDSNRRSNSCRQRHSNTTTPSARMTLPEMTT